MNIHDRIEPKYSAVQEISVHTDTRDVLAHARRSAIRRGLQDWFVCDIDAHHVETVSWKEIVTYIEDPVIRDNAIRFQAERIGTPPYGMNGDLGLRYQSVGGHSTPGWFAGGRHRSGRSSRCHLDAPGHGLARH
jgi:uncharacterized protein